MLKMNGITAKIHGFPPSSIFATMMILSFMTPLSESVIHPFQSIMTPGRVAAWRNPLSNPEDSDVGLFSTSIKRSPYMGVMKPIPPRAVMTSWDSKETENALNNDMDNFSSNDFGSVNSVDSNTGGGAGYNYNLNNNAWSLNVPSASNDMYSFNALTNHWTPPKDKDPINSNNGKNGIKKKYYSCPQPVTKDSVTIHPDPNYCNRFYYCLEGNAYIFQCTKGHNYNPLIKACDLPYFACGNRA